jgi:hypothetical protein
MLARHLDHSLMDFLGDGRLSKANKRLKLVRSGVASAS